MPATIYIKVDSSKLSCSPMELVQAIKAMISQITGSPNVNVVVHDDHSVKDFMSQSGGDV